MGLIENSALLCLAIQQGGEETGRTKLQKMIYFADRYLGWNVSDYKLHYYGPYSRNIATTLRTIRNELIDENIPVIGPYQYQVRDEGRHFLETFGERCDANQLEATSALFTQFGEWTKDELEIATTLDYVDKNTPGINRDGLIEKVSIIKDNFDTDFIQKVSEKWSAWKADHEF